MKNKGKKMLVANTKNKVNKAWFQHAINAGLVLWCDFYKVYADKNGNIYNQNEEYLKSFFTDNGYKYVITPKGAELVLFVVAETFLSLKKPAGKKAIAYHKNGDISNNKLDNIDFTVVNNFDEFDEIVRAATAIASISLSEQKESAKLNDNIPKSTYSTQKGQSIPTYNPIYDLFFTEAGEVFKNVDGKFVKQNTRILKQKTRNENIMFYVGFQRYRFLKEGMASTFNEAYMKHPQKFEILFKDKNPLNCKMSNLSIIEKDNVPKCIKDKFPSIPNESYLGCSLYPKKDFSRVVYSKRNKIFISYDGFALKNHPQKKEVCYSSMYLATRGPLRVKGCKHAGYVKSIVAAEFFDGYDAEHSSKYTIIHKDGNPQNCSVDNLRIVVRETGIELQRKSDEEIAKLVENSGFMRKSHRKTHVSTPKYFNSNTVTSATSNTEVNSRIFEFMRNCLRKISIPFVFFATLSAILYLTS